MNSLGEANKSARMFLYVVSNYTCYRQFPFFHRKKSSYRQNSLSAKLFSSSVNSNYCYISTQGVILPPTSFLQSSQPPQQRSARPASRPPRRPRAARRARQRRRGGCWVLEPPRLPPENCTRTERGAHRTGTARCSERGQRNTSPAKRAFRERKTHKKRRAGSKDPPAEAIAALGEDGLSETFVPPCRAGPAACWTRLRAARLPGALLLHAQASGKPCPTFASSSTVRSPPRVRTSFSAQFHHLQGRQTRLPLSAQLQAAGEFTPCRQKTIPSAAAGSASPLTLQPDCPFRASPLCRLHLI